MISSNTSSYPEACPGFPPKPNEFMAGIRDFDTGSSIDSRSESSSSTAILSSATTSGIESLPEVTKVAPEVWEIRNAYSEEIGAICHWRRKEFGLRSHHHFLQSLYDCDPLGWFVALNETGNIIGNIYAMNFSNTLAFGGLYGVEKGYRCQGIGGMLWNVRLNHVGDRNFVINAVESRLKANIKQGMKPSFKMATYVGYLSPEKVRDYMQSTQAIHESNDNVEIIILNPNVNAQYNEKLLDALISYDATVCQFARPLFLRDTIRHYDTTLTVLAINRETTDDQSAVINILGYGLLRPKYVGQTIGPLYATSPNVATSILRTLISAVNSTSDEGSSLHPFDLTIIEEESNSEISLVSKNLIDKLALDKEYLLYRMYSKDDILLPLNNVYAITCTESFLL